MALVNTLQNMEIGSSDTDISSNTDSSKASKSNKVLTTNTEEKTEDNSDEIVIK
ncbi:hypothetical protein L3081_03175 [Colwellia sp. MSW7]|uniref:Uncharacterized protein n=1 Tax=Colwellia maritima TaxID=2912588 RepID=A0ABS9WYH6_9GAMM|nr:hypothetical protein [Colwellia maritima]MCI2282582.1 hypothetical protein [Colwellia maritima]